jgi:murein DD-endopeptidase MepM/ murein hydrolase activator NlpD
VKLVQKNIAHLAALFVAAALTCVSQAALGAEKGAFYLLDIRGKVILTDGQGSAVSRAPGTLLDPGITLQTLEDGEALFAGMGRFYKAGNFTTVEITEKQPELLRGRLSWSGSLTFPELELKPFGPVRQGGTLKLVLETPDPAPSINAWVRGSAERPVSFFPNGESTYRALCGFDVASKPGEYQLTVEVMSEGGAVTRLRTPFQLEPVQWKTGAVYLTASKGTIFQPSERKKAERRELSEILMRISKKQLWKGSFIFPIPDPYVVSEFGKKRTYYINGKRRSVSYHRGIDLRGAIGRNVYAAGDGVAVFAGERLTSGNTVVIDHGQGVFTLYFHLDSVVVSVDQPVSKQDKIGTVGMTGLAAGPHLHWGLMVDGYYVDPAQWVENTY